MSRSRRARRSRQAKEKAARKRGPILRGNRTAAIVALLLGLSVVVTGGMLARRQRARNSKGAAGRLSPQTAGTPSKEYIYAGGRLIATEEPTAPAPNPPTNVIASVTSYGPTSSTITVSWTPPAGQITSYNVVRKTSVGDPGFSQNTVTPVISFPDTVNSGATYLYQVSAVAGGATSQLSPLSSTSFATAISFVFTAPTPTLALGSVISATHVNTIRMAIDKVRLTTGRGAAVYPNSIGSGTPIAASDHIGVPGPPSIEGMRQAISDVYSDFGFSPPQFNNAVSQGATVKFLDYLNLVTAVRGFYQ